jgi:hypothetical protein
VGDAGEHGHRDQPRFLAAQSQYGYTDRIDRALRDEPEAVTSEEQHRLTQEAHRRAGQRRLEAWVSTSSTINGALDAFVAAVGADPRLSSGVRNVRRVTAALGRQVQAQ